jgi:lysophospholipase L1-like esterase
MTATNATRRGDPLNVPILARGGYTVATMKALIDADLAASTQPAVQYVLFNLGANDMAALPAEAVWEADALYIIDALKVKWPSVKVYLMRPWTRPAGMATANTLAGWIATVVAARAGVAYSGPDERVFLENGDDGATYMVADGIHPNAAGYALTAAQWKTVLGY